MTVWYAVWNQTSFIPHCIPDSHPHRVTNTNRRIDTVIPPDDGRATHVEKIKILRKNCAPSWLDLQDQIFCQDRVRNFWTETGFYLII